MKKPNFSQIALPFILFALCIPLLAGCAQVKAIQRADQIERTTRVNQLRFLERVSDAYFLIGNEYYQLAVEAEKQGKTEKKDEFANKASVYLLFCKNIRKDAEDLRVALESSEAEGWQGDMGLFGDDTPETTQFQEDQVFAAPGSNRY